MKTKKVWAIFYRVRSNSHSKWSGWAGPCGIHVVLPISPSELVETLSGRPFFFRTRKQARAAATKLGKEKNITWTWVQYCVKPAELTYRII